MALWFDVCFGTVALAHSCRIDVTRVTGADTGNVEATLNEIQFGNAINGFMISDVINSDTESSGETPASKTDGKSTNAGESSAPKVAGHQTRVEKVKRICDGVSKAK